MKKAKLLILPFIFALNVNAQSFLHGDFERISAPGCRYNLDNASFNALVPDVFSFGNTFHAGTYGEADAITTGCLEGPYEGSWAMMIACEANTTDKIAMKLDNPLIVGYQYQLTFYAIANTSSNPTMRPIEFGYSSNSNLLGTVVGQITPTDSAYTQYSLTFTPTSAGQYITMRVVPDGQNNSASIVDYFTLSVITSAENLPAYTLTLSPNPVSDLLTISGTESATVTLHDLTGKLCHQQSFTEGQSKQLDVSALSSGVYMVNVVSGKGVWKEKVVVE